MEQYQANARENIYKLAGRARNERKTLGVIGGLHTRRIAKVSIDDDETELSFSFLKGFLWLSSTLLIITLGLLLIAKLYGARLTSGEHTTSTSLKSVVIGNDKLSIPQNAIRFSPQRHSGRHEKIELYRHWPSLSGYVTQLDKEFSPTNNTENLIFLTLEKRSTMLDMSGRIAEIYENFFEGEGKLQSYGLMRQGLSAQGGYIDEDLYYAVDSPYPFATRCIKDSEALMRPICIRDIQIGKSMMLTYRFHKKLLPQWIELDQALRAHVKSMITNL